MPVEQLLMEVNGPPELVDELGTILVGHGVREAIDIAHIEESMVEDIGERMELAELLRAAVAHARPLIGGWVRAVTRFKVGAGGVVPVGGPEFGQASPEGGPEPRRASHDGVVGGPTGAVGGTDKARAGPARATRLLRGFTRGALPYLQAVQGPGRGGHRRWSCSARWS